MNEKRGKVWRGGKYAVALGYVYTECHLCITDEASRGVWEGEGGRELEEGKQGGGEKRG